MKFTPTKIDGVWIVDMERKEDDRGWFSRTWCEEEMVEHGLDACLAQCSSSFNERRGTLRGMHFQAPPHEETKLVRCTRGAMFDVVLDLRPQSPSFTQWVSVELTAENGRALYIPEGCAHGFQTLVDHTEVYYMISQKFAPDSARGYRWNDPTFGITWPLPEARVISTRDEQLPFFREAAS